MRKNTTERIVRYSAEDVPEGATDWNRLRAMSEDEIERGANEDDDNPPLTLEQLEGGSVVTLSERRKVPIYIRLDADVVEYYKEQGPGYQTRINQDLRLAVGMDKRKAQRR